MSGTTFTSNCPLGKTHTTRSRAGTTPVFRCLKGGALAFVFEPDNRRFRVFHQPQQRARAGHTVSYIYLYRNW